MSIAPFIGQELPERVFGPITMTDIVRYQGASGDLNPMHHDDDLARSAGFPAAFSVGMLSAGWLASVCTEHFGETAVRRFRTRFTGLVYRGDTLTARATVTDISTVDDETRADLTLEMRTQAGVVVVEGAAQVALEESVA